MTRVIFLTKYSVLNGEVVYRETGKKARGKFEIKEGKFKTSIYKISEKTGKKKFVGFSGKMGKKTLKVAEKLQKTRIVRAINKALKQSGLTKFAKEEYERQMVQRKQTALDSEEPITQREQDDYREKVKKGSDKLSRESVRAIGSAKRSGIDLYGMISKESQNMINFERIVTAMEHDGTLSLDKINKMIETKNFASTDFLESGEEILDSLADFASLLPNNKFDNVSDFAMWLFVKYRDSDRITRTSLWDLLHSFYPEQGYTYDPLSV